MIEHIKFLAVVPIINRRLFVYCVQIVFEQRLPGAASIVHFAHIFVSVASREDCLFCAYIKRRSCHAVHASVLFHRAIFCIPRVLLRAL